MSTSDETEHRNVSFVVQEPTHVIEALLHRTV